MLHIMKGTKKCITGTLMHKLFALCMKCIISKFTTYLLYGKLQLLHNRLQKLYLRGGSTAYNCFPSGQNQSFSVITNFVNSCSVTGKMSVRWIHGSRGL